MRRRKLILVALFSLLVLLAVAMPASAQDGDVTDDEVNDVASQLYCPICENVPLDVCPTKACSDWREEIRGLLADGATEQEVKDYFVDRYGVRVLGEPPKQGITLAVWVLPGVALVVGAIVLARNVTRMRRAAPAGTDSAPVAMEGIPDADKDYAERIERELGDF